MSGGQIFRNGKRGRGLRRPLCHRQLAVQSLRVGVDLGIRVGVHQRLLGGVAGATFLFYQVEVRVLLGNVPQEGLDGFPYDLYGVEGMSSRGRHRGEDRRERGCRTRWGGRLRTPERWRAAGGECVLGRRVGYGSRASPGGHVGLRIRRIYFACSLVFI